ncbi:DUF397 domain-containing protein [Micromonospora sp. NPDC003197]
MVEPAFNPFRKSRRSDGGQNCVEVATAADGAAARVRDSKDSAGPFLAFDAHQWAAFIGAVKTFKA